MRKLFRTLALLLTSLLAIFMLVSCGADESDGEEKIPPAALVSADPPSSSRIAVNTNITLTFDNAPTDVAVSGYTVTVAGKTATILGPFTPGALVLTVTWADGTQTLKYTATAPNCCDVRVVGGMVRNGDTGIDPEAINNEGKIEILFSDEVTGSIALQTEVGEDIGWLGKVEGNIGILELVKGRELGNEITYIIIAKVSNDLGDEFMFKITFVTKAKV